MALRMWGQVIIQAATPEEDPVVVGTEWVDISGTPTLKLCTAVAPYTWAAISGGAVALDDLSDVVITAAASGDYLRFNGTNWVDVAASQLASDLAGLVAPSSHNHTSGANDGGVLTNDEHDGFSDFTGIATPATPSAGHARLHAVTSNGHTQFNYVDQDGTVIRLARDQVLIVRNTSGGSITKGQTVEIYSATGGVPEIRLADADSSPARPCSGFAFETMANNAYGLILLSGAITGLDTSAFIEGITIYLDTTAGGITATVPTSGAGISQTLGVVSRAHATLGALEVFIALPVSHGFTHQSGGGDPIKLDDFATPDDNTDLNANTTNHGLLLKATAPASGLLSAVGIGNGETVYSMKPLFDTTNPAALGTAGPGTQLVAARRDHIHTLPKLDDLAAPDDNTDLNVSASAHGLVPKFPNNTTTFFRGDGTYATPSAGGAPTQIQRANISFASGDTSQTATISSVTSTATSELFHNGTAGDVGGNGRAFVRLTLTNQTTVTGTRDTSGTAVTTAVQVTSWS